MQSTQTNTLYAGADLHGNNVFLSVCDAQGTELFHRRVPADIAAVSAAMEPYLGRISALGVESTCNWYWLVDGLRDLGCRAVLGNPAKMKQYSGLKSSDDRSDARWLAEMLRLGIFPESYIYPRQTRAVRDLLRRRQFFVQRRVQAQLSLESLLCRYGTSLEGGIRTWTQKEIHALGMAPFVEMQIETMLEAFHGNDRLAKRIEEAVTGFVEPCGDFKRVQTVPGIGPVLGMVILLESGEFSRFKNAGNYASYCRTVKSERTSNSRKKGENNRRNGNPYLAWAFIEAAYYAARYYPPIQSWYERKKNNRLEVIAKKALASKLSKAVWHVMNGKEFEMKLMFG